MTDKYSDYAKVKKVILSCKTTGQNNVAYHMVWLFCKKWNDVVLSSVLFELVDLNCVELCNGR